MQLLEHWDPLSLPRGSVRALVTLSLLGVLWALMLLGREVPLFLSFLVLVTAAHYFGSRGGKHEPERRPPLFLPRGSVRLIIVAGFAIVGYFLISEGRLQLSLRDTGSATILMVAALVAGFLLRALFDFVTRGRAIAPRRWFENLKAVVVLMAAVLLAFIVFTGAEQPAQQNFILAASLLVVFYFGSRHS